MKVAIMTFHTAHNYGAALQAYALKEHLLSIYESVGFIDYTAEPVHQMYRITPFKQPLTLKAVISRIMKIKYRIPQYTAFCRFQKQYLRPNIPYENAIQSMDCIVCGSDQIWNTEITGDDERYFLPSVGSGTRRVSYAASFGRKNLSEAQQTLISRYLPAFDALSLRESDGLQEVERSVGHHVDVVMDPVFLLSDSEWRNLTVCYGTHADRGKYILYYALKNDAELICNTEKLAAEQGCKIFIIHPIGVRQPIGGEQIYNVGPREFLEIIMHAEYVCTNSFHAAAFSVIFGKKLYHHKDTSYESRVESMLDSVGVYETCKKMVGGINYLDLSRVDRSRLQSRIEHSKRFLAMAIEF